MQHGRNYSWFSEDDLKKCVEEIQPYIWWIKYGSDKKAKYYLGHLFGNISATLQDSKTPRKVTLFSAHDSTIVGVLFGLGKKWVEQPTYSAALMIELGIEGKKQMVRVNYRTITKDHNSTTKIHVEGCKKEHCTLEEFTKRLEKVKLTDEEYNKMCVEKKEEKLSLATILAIVATIIIVLQASVLFLLCLKRRRPTANFYTAVGDDA